MTSFYPLIVGYKTFFNDVAGNGRSSVVSGFGPCNSNAVFGCFHSSWSSWSPWGIWKGEKNRKKVKNVEGNRFRNSCKKFLIFTERMLRSYWLSSGCRIGHPIFVFCHYLEFIILTDGKISNSQERCSYVTAYLNIIKIKWSL